jgi:hypothetical protein
MGSATNSERRGRGRHRAGGADCPKNLRAAREIGADSRVSNIDSVGSASPLVVGTASQTERKMIRRIGVLLVATVIGALCLELGENALIPGVYGVVSSAQAVVGRPRTPRSVAGVARRTYRRCATGVYYC